MGEKVKIEKCVIQSILKLYGLDSEFTEQKEYIHYYDEYGYNVKIVLSVLLKSGQRVVIKIVNIKEDNLLEDGHKIEKQSAYSEFMAKAMSLSSASITGAIAATAEPPQMPVPAEIRLLNFQFSPNNLRMK